MLAAGLSVSCATDNRLMSATTLCHELDALHTQTGLTLAQLADLQANGMQASFLPAAVRDAGLARLHQWRSQAGI
jgi:adenosine deaminase